MKLFLLLLLFVALVLRAQPSPDDVLISAQGHHERNHPSAALELRSAHHGLLLPRVPLASLKDRTTVATPAHSLLLYNTASAGSGAQHVEADRTYWWNASTGAEKWEVFLRAKDIEEKKAVTEFAIASTQAQLLASTDLTHYHDARTNANRAVSLRWNAATDIVSRAIFEGTDCMSLVGNTVRVNKGGIYMVSGQVQLKLVTPSSSTEPSCVALVLQTSTDGGTTWTTRNATLTTYEKGGVGTRTLIFPQHCYNFSAGIHLRLALAHAEGGQAESGTGVASVVTGETTRSFRFTRFK